MRGLDVLEEVASGPVALPQLATRLGLARSTTHRLATALLERRYLTLVPREGYGLGPKLLELGRSAQEQIALIRVARPYLDRLAAESLDTALLVVAAEASGLVLERVPGRRRLLPALRPGERMSLTTTAAGCALLFDAGEQAWRDGLEGGAAETPEQFAARMRANLRAGYAADAADVLDGLCAVAAPVRGYDGAIIASLCVTGAAQFWTDARRAALGRMVAEAATSLSRDLGFSGRPDVHPSKPAAPEHNSNLAPGAETVRSGRVGRSRHGRQDERLMAETSGQNTSASEENTIPNAKAVSHLEAGTLSVHDPLSQGLVRPGKGDVGVSDAPESRPARRGSRLQERRKGFE